MVFVGALHATPSPQGVTYPLIPLQPNGLRRGAACNALAARHRLPDYSNQPNGLYGRNVMRPQLAPRCGVAFLIISCSLVARMGRPPLGPPQGIAYPIILFQPNGLRTDAT